MNPGTAAPKFHEGRGNLPKRDDLLAGIELAPAPPFAVNQDSDPIGRDGPTTDSAAGLATGEWEVRGDAGARDPL
jgi:hypothetical protein